jgi:hypothetical protein
MDYLWWHIRLVASERVIRIFCSPSIKRALETRIESECEPVAWLFQPGAPRLSK